MISAEAPLLEESIFKWLKMLIFDWSGVVSDDMLPIWQANIRILPGLRAVSCEEWQKMAGSSPGLADFLAKVGWMRTLAEFRIANQKAYNEVVSEGIYIPKIRMGVREALEKLTDLGFPLAVVSNHPQANILREAEAYGVIDFFRQIVGGVVDDKAEALMQICEQYGCDPNKTVYIGDSVGDIRAAKATGLFSIAVKGGYTPPHVLIQEDPDFLIKDLTDLLSL